MGVPRARIATGSEPLDSALGGGLPEGFTLLVEGPQGVGSTELAFTLLRTAARRGRGKGRKACFLSALRSARRAAGEAEALFGTPASETGITFVDTMPARAKEAVLATMGSLQTGDVLAFESVAALEHPAQREGVCAAVQALSDAAQECGVLFILLNSPGSLDDHVEHRVAECVDGVFSFSVREAGSSRRRALTVTKMRGLAPALEGDQMPVFEASLRSGIGFAIAAVKSVV